MPHITINGVDLYYEEHGSGPETIVFSHGLLFSGDMFGAQVAALKDRYRCITYDHRGQGRSAVPASGYDIDSLTADAAALINALDAAPCHFAGLSMGGFVALRLGFRQPEMLRSLILMETSAQPEPSANIPRYRLLGFIARWFGLGVILNRVMPILFGPTFLNDPDRAADRQRWREHLANIDRIGAFRSLRGVINREGVSQHLGQITVPTLIIVGSEDVATVPAKSEHMHANIPNSQYVIIPGAGHTSTVEQPAAVNAAITEFLDSLS